MDGRLEEALIMADAHSDDPNVAPLRQQVRTSFSGLQVMLLTAMGSVAIIAGIVCGIVFANN